jgi:hypothetical protein
MGLGKGGGNSSPAADAQARLAQQLFTQTDPIRQALIGRSAGFLGASPVAAGAGMAPGLGFNLGSGGGGILSEILRGVPGINGPVAPPVTGLGDMVSSPMDVTSTPTFAAFKHTADQTFNRAKDNTIARMPGGGAMAGALAGLEGDRATALTQGAGAIYGDELSRAMALGTGMTGTSLGSLGQAAQTQAAQMAAAADRDAQKAGDAGSAAAMFALKSS